MIHVKICGLKTIEDLDASIKSGAKWAGFVFYNKSIRNLSVSKAYELSKFAKNKILIVALFVNPKKSLIDSVVSKVKPNFIQLHGNESPEICLDIWKNTGIPIIKAIQIHNKDDLISTQKYSGKVDKILFDTKLNTKKLVGKSKQTIDWNIFENLDINNEWMLAGGLNKNNIKNAVLTSKAKSVDISSGVEKTPGNKSPYLIKQFLNVVNSI